MKDKTTIIITKATRDELIAVGRKGESYDAVIVRLLDNFKLQQI